MPTSTDLGVRVLDLLGVTQVGQNPAAEDVEKVQSFVPNIVKQLQDERVAIINTAVISTGVFEQFATVVASMVAPSFGQPRDDASIAANKDALRVAQATEGGQFTRNRMPFAGDAARQLGSGAAFVGDAQRGLQGGTGFAGDVRAPLSRADGFAGDSKTALGQTNAFAGDTARALSAGVAFAGDQPRALQAAPGFSGETSRPLSAGSSFAGETSRPLSAGSSFAGETSRPLAAPSTFAGDKRRQQ